MSYTYNNYNSTLVIAVLTIAIFTRLFEAIPLKSIERFPVKVEEEHNIAVPGSRDFLLVMQKEERVHESSFTNVTKKTKQQEYEEEKWMVPRNQLKRRVLIVDNEPDITFVFKMGLEDKGFIVDAFEDPVLALSNFKSNYYDIILLDIGMPEMNGFDLYENIINIDNSAKVCFLTASEALHANLIEKYLKAIEPAHSCFIAKPIEMDDLVEKVNKEIMRG